MRPISLLSIMALCLTTGQASVLMNEQQPMREDTPIRTTAGWEYVDCGLWFNPCRNSLCIKRVIISRCARLSP